MNVEKGYWAGLGAIAIISFAPLIMLIGYPIENATILFFFIYGALSLFATANLASYLTTSYYSKQGRTKKIWTRVLYIIINILIILYNINQVIIIHFAF